MPHQQSVQLQVQTDSLFSRGLFQTLLSLGASFCG
ncbi:hypothetical protein C7378_1977 [Acidipila rosea]|uniref:Uncharacterized protein n=1 Tax=Acidipila rosea TaxID=768535 RepID=A0A4R1L7Z0_9BACT|nr:hypothetical protein C7378_1977 [Acidipila rosea]